MPVYTFTMFIQTNISLTDTAISQHTYMLDILGSSNKQTLSKNQRNSDTIIWWKQSMPQESLQCRGRFHYSFLMKKNPWCYREMGLP